jgi:glycosyltransferase involved in cell wall biosynthesis
MPDISVLLPVYNAEAYLEKALESVLSQSHRNFELIVLNDGSSDASLNILNKYAEIDERVTAISRENRGLVRSLNEMLAIAQGNFIARMDADDIARPDRFSRQIEFLRANENVVAAGSTVEIIDPDGDPLLIVRNPFKHEDIDSWHLRAGNGAAMCHPSVMMRAEALRGVGAYREEYWPAEDGDLFLRLAEVGRLENIQEVLLSYRVHISSIGHQNPMLQREAMFRAASDAAVRRHLEQPTARSSDLPLKPLEPWRHHQLWAWWALSSGHTSTARKHAWRACRQAPDEIESWRVLFCALRGY